MKAEERRIYSFESLPPWDTVMEAFVKDQPTVSHCIVKIFELIRSRITSKMIQLFSVNIECTFFSLKSFPKYMLPKIIQRLEWIQFSSKVACKYIMCVFISYVILKGINYFGRRSVERKYHFAEMDFAGFSEFIDTEITSRKDFITLILVIANLLGTQEQNRRRRERKLVNEVMRVHFKHLFIIFRSI